MPTVTSCTVWKSETSRKSSPNLDTTRAKAILRVEGRAKPTKNVFVVARWPHHGRLQSRDETHVNGDFRNPRPGKEKLEKCEEEEQEIVQTVPLGMIDLGLLKCSQTTATPSKTTLFSKNPQINSERLCHRCHVLLDSRRHGLQGIQTGSF